MKKQFPTPRGFTLIELLMAMTITGVLAAIAIPSFHEYRGRGFDARARNDLRAVATAEEAYFTDYLTYISCTDTSCVDDLPGIPYLSQGILLTMTGTTSGFVGTSRHASNGSITFNWNSENGGLNGL